MAHISELKSRSSVEKVLANQEGAGIHAINTLYAGILDRARKTDTLTYEVATRVLRLIMCSNQTMSPTALLAAATVASDGSVHSLELSELLSICSNLIVLDQELDTVRLAHASVREYLTGLPEFTWAKANSTAAQSCIVTCINNPYPDLSAGVNPAKDFDVYAAMYWAVHYNASDNFDRDRFLDSALKDFVLSDEDLMSPFRAWVCTVDEISKVLPENDFLYKDLSAVKSATMSPLCTACIYGLDIIIRSLGEEGSLDIDERNERGHTGIYLASAVGQVCVVEGLLQLGADVAIECGHHGTPLKVACANGHAEVVRLLLSLPNDVITADSINSALQTALRNGHEDVAMLLLQKDVLTASQDMVDQVFDAAAGLGFAELMCYLHKNTKLSLGERKLLPKGAEKTFDDSKIVRFRNHFKNGGLPDDAVATAAFYGQNEVTQFCIDEGSDIEKEGTFGTPLRAASLMGHDSTVRILLTLGADVNAIGSFGDALQAAATKGHLSVATTLIKHNAKLNNSGGYYGNALQAATYRGHAHVVEALLNAGASVMQRGLFNDAVSAAVSAGHYSILDLLMASGYRSPYVNFGHGISFAEPRYSMAPPPRHLDLLSSLDRKRWTTPVAVRPRDERSLTKGQDLSFEDTLVSIHGGIQVSDSTELSLIQRQKQHGSDALLMAASTGLVPVIRRMIGLGDEIGLAEHAIGEALQAASSAGQLSVVEYILSTSKAPSSYIPTSMERAAWYGHIAILQRLLECEEALGPPPNSSHKPYSAKEQLGRQYRNPLPSETNEECRWSNYFFPDRDSERTEMHETFANGHVLRILLQGCQGDQPGTVQFAFRLSNDFGLRNLPQVALRLAARSNSVHVLKYIFREGAIFEGTAIAKACSEAEACGALPALYFLLQRKAVGVHQLQNFWRVFETAANENFSDLLEHLINETLNLVDDLALEKMFIKAAERGYLSAIQIWYQRVRTFDSYKHTLSHALDQSCAHGHADVATYLIKCGVHVNELAEEPAKEGKTSPHYSRFWFTLKHVAVQQNAWPRTALHACFQATPQCDRDDGSSEGAKYFGQRKRDFLRKQEKVVEVLLRNGADVDIIDKHGRRPLYYAALLSSAATVRAFLDRGASLMPSQSPEKSLLELAAWREVDSFPVFQVLIEAGAVITVTRSAEGTSSTILDAALDVFAHTNTHGSSRKTNKAGYFIESESIHQVLTTGPGAVVRWLLRNQPELQATAEGFSLLLQMASADGDAEFVQLLIERSVNVGVDAHYFGTALNAAAAFGHLLCVKLLVEAGADINLKSKVSGDTPLRSAVEGQHIQVVQYLLETGVDMHSTDYSTDESLNYQSGHKHDSTLKMACSSGNLQLVQLLLSNSLKSRSRSGDLSIALHYACSGGHAAIVEYMLGLGADIEAEHTKCPSSLVAAARAGHAEVLELLLAAGAVIYDTARGVNVLKELVTRKGCQKATDSVFAQLLNTPDFIPACKECPSFMRQWQEDAEFVLMVNGIPASELLLTQVVALGAQRCVDLLLEIDNNLINTNSSALQVLQTAAEFQRYELLSRLLSKYTSPDHMPPNCETLVHTILHLLMPAEAAIDRPCCYSPPPWWSMEARRTFKKSCKCHTIRTTASEVVLQVVQITGADINTSIGKWGGPLPVTAYLGMLELVRFCVDSGVDVDSTGGFFGCALNAAIRGKNIEVVKVLLQQHANVNPPLEACNTPLHLACKAESEIIIRLLLDHGAYVDLATPTSGTALHIACKLKRLEMAEILLESGANVNALGPELGTPLHIACEMQDEQMLNVLLQHGADANITTTPLGAVLHMTCKSSNTSMTKRLLEHGANVNIYAEKHGTPLHVACANLQADTICHLLKYGADVNAKGCKQETPLTALLSVRIWEKPLPALHALIASGTHLDFTTENLDRLVRVYARTYDPWKPTALQSLLDQNRHVLPSPNIIRSAIPGSSSLCFEVLKLLLDRAPHVKITSDMVTSVRNVDSLQLLLQHGSGLEVTPDLMGVFVHNPDTAHLAKFLREAAPDVMPSSPTSTARAHPDVGWQWAR